MGGGGGGGGGGGAKFFPLRVDPHLERRQKKKKKKLIELLPLRVYPLTIKVRVHLLINRVGKRQPTTDLMLGMGTEDLMEIEHEIGQVYVLWDWCVW